MKLLCLITSSGERIPVVNVSSLDEAYEQAIAYLHGLPVALPSQWELWETGPEGTLVMVERLLDKAF